MQQPSSSTTAPSAPGARLSRIFFLSFGYIALRFLLSPLRSRLLTEQLSKELYGALTLAVMTITFIATLLTLGGYEFMVRRLPGIPPDEQKGWLRLLLARLALPGWLLAGAVAALLKATGLLPAVTLPELALLWSALGLTMWLLYRVFFALGTGRLTTVRAVQLTQNDLWFLAIFASGTWAAASFLHTLWIWVGWLILTAVGVKLLARLPGRPTAPQEGLPAVLRYGIPLLPMMCGEILFRLADRYILLAFFDLSRVADYILAMNITMIAYVTGCSLLDLTIPALYAATNRRLPHESLDPSPDMRAIFSLMIRHMTALGIALGTTLALFHRDIFQIIAGPAFRDASSLLPWMSLIPLAFLLSTTVSRALLALNRSRLVGGATLAAALLNLLLDLLIVPRHGPIGAALATLFSLLLLNFGLGAVLGWRRWLTRAEWRPFTLLISSAVCVAGLCAIRWALPPLSPWIRLPLAALWIAAVLFSFRIFSTRDMQHLTLPRSTEK